MSNIWAFDHIKNKHSLCHREDFMKKFCSVVLQFCRKHATSVIDFKKKKMLSLTKKLLKLHQDATVCYICRKRFIKNDVKYKNYGKVRDHCY